MRVLVGDDQRDVLEAARLVLKGGGHETVTAATPDGVLCEARRQSFDVLLLDMNYGRDTTSGREGLDLLNGLRASGVSAPVVVMTAWGSIDVAVEAMRRGAVDFVEKPWDNGRLLATIDRCAAARSGFDIARRVQHRLLGRADVAIPNLDYAGASLPFGEIGGDYFDFFDLGGESLGIALADVSGKGAGAGLLMAHLQAAFRSREDLGNDPLRMIEAVNRLFWRSSPAEQFATVFYGVYDSRTRLLRYVNAGHCGPVVLGADGASRSLESTGMPVGMFSVWQGDERTARLHAGDRMALVSDGVIEAGMQDGCEYGEGGVLETLRRCVRKSAASTVEQILAEAARRGPEDDMTAVVLCAGDDR